MASSFWELVLEFSVRAWWQAHVSTPDRWPRSCCLLGPKGSGQACFLPSHLPQSGALAPAESFPRVSLAARIPSPCSDRRVRFLKALSTGDNALLSQADGMPRQRGYRSIRVLLHRAVETSSGKQQAASPRPDSDFPECCAFSEGMPRQRDFRSMRVSPIVLQILG